MIIGLIPSRLNSKRLKNKPLLNIDGLPIILHSYLRSKLSKKLNDLIVCTDSKKIKSVIEERGGKCVLTSKKHRNGTERIFEYAKKIKNAKLIIDIQGDQPLIDPVAIDKVISFHLRNYNKYDIVVPCIKSQVNTDSKNLVKVIFSGNRIVYFSRAKVPYDFKNNNPNYFRDLSIVSFKPESLKKYVKSKYGYLEKIEGIELLRALENNLTMGTFEIKTSSFAVDVNQDLLRAIDLMPTDKFRKFY